MTLGIILVRMSARVREAAAAEGKRWAQEWSAAKGVQRHAQRLLGGHARAPQSNVHNTLILLLRSSGRARLGASYLHSHAARTQQTSPQSPCSDVSERHVLV